MKLKRFVAATMAALVVACAVALPASAAYQLTVRGAAEKSMEFAEHTCDHDPNCVRYGVTNCSRQALHVILCRIFDERSTAEQGQYACTKLVRVALDPYNPGRAVVTGDGDYSCG